MVRAEIEPVDADAVVTELAVHLIVKRPDVILGEVPSSDAGLTRDHDGCEPGFGKETQALGRARQELLLIGP